MRQGARRLAALGAAAVLAAGIAACGGADSGETARDGAATSPQADSRGGGSPGGKGTGGGAGAGDGTQRSGGKGGADAGDGSSEFTPRQHDDSGGGSEQFRLQGGDNSVQEFGSEAGEAEFEQAAAALHNFLDARAQGAWAAACRYLSSDVAASLQQLGGQAEGGDAGCPVLLRKLTNPAAKGLLRREAARADVGSLRREGDRAFVIYRGLDKTIMAIPMAQEDGDWKVASLAGTPLN